MSRIVVIGEAPRVAGFGIAGAVVREANDASAASRAWQELADDVEVVILTRAAAAATHELACPPRRLRVVMPA